MLPFWWPVLLIPLGAVVYWLTVKWQDRRR